MMSVATLVQPDISAIVVKIEQHSDSRWAWANYGGTVRELVKVFDQPTVIELGGGRFPFFSRQEVEILGINYASNDISERELSLGPDWMEKAHFDIQTSDATVIAPYRERYDLAFSKMVMEHVPNYRRAYRNIHTILKPGGVSIAFHPVLFCLPFVANRLMPERFSAAVLKAVFPDRTDQDIPKFPAVYSGCRISESVRRELFDIGFRKVWQVPFFGHRYYQRFPILRDVQGWTARRIAERRATALASYAFTILQK